MEIKETGREIVKTLQSADNEGTESPWWMIIDPRGLADQIKKSEDVDHNDIVHSIASSIAGPFFSRSDAQNYLDAKGYEYSKHARVYCKSGHWSHKYKNFCRAVNPGLNFRRIKNAFQAPKTVKVPADTRQEGSHL